jgi:hypothetical protein
MRNKQESAALQQATAAVKKDIEILSSRMKEDIATMKHEYVSCGASCVAGSRLNIFTLLGVATGLRWNWITGRTRPKLKRKCAALQ